MRLVTEFELFQAMRQLEELQTREHGVLNADVAVLVEPWMRARVDAVTWDSLSERARSVLARAGLVTS
jgi:hypothetical protein